MAHIGQRVEVSWASGAYEIGGEPYRRNSSVMRTVPKPALEAWKSAQLRQATIDAVLANLDQIRAIQKSAKDTAGAYKGVYDFVSSIGKGDNKALKFGSEVHQMIEDSVRRVKREYSFTVTAGHRNAANSAFTWKREMGRPVRPGPIVEMVVFNPKYRIAGRLDYWHGPQTFTADWKTGKALYADYAIQLTLYTRIMTHAIIPQSSITPDGYTGTVLNWDEKVAGKSYVVHLRKQADPVAKLVNPEHQHFIKRVIESAINIDNWVDRTYTYRGSAPKIEALINDDA